MRLPLLMANWKMNLGVAESQRLAQALLRRGARDLKHLDVVLFPSFVALPAVASALKRSKLRLGAQDVFWAETGNFTGAVSPTQLTELGCTWSLIGHSERREHFGETDEMIDRKTAAALRYGLTPVLCVGETREERSRGQSEVVVEHQIRSALRYIRPPFPGQRLIIAYEPRWSISPGLPCEPDDAEAMARVIQQVLIDRYDVQRAEENFTIVYGGSVDAGNIADYLEREPIAGALVGRASQSVDTLIPLVSAMAHLRKAAPRPTKRSNPKKQSTKRTSARH